MIALKKIWLSILLALIFTPYVAAEDVHIAVAANFTAAMKEISRVFERESGHKTRVSFGSTGKLYAQIVNNAPFELFLAAGQERPRLLYEQAVSEQKPITYAIGKLVLWSRDAQREVSLAALQAGDFKRLALGNPKTAPYGTAAAQVLKHLQLGQALRKKWVLGESIAQAYQFVATGNAELGFVALAQVSLNDSGARWLVPQSYYEPIRQNAILLKRGRNNPAASAFWSYLQSPAAQAIIQQFGYAIPQ
ncbi:molybdate ABC transporter substrate-binding protein [Candidatus Venteria ishoeyi]|uniref:molybdate ABC transporter substrate-binding protein n=1 Tax=Candidatus Venteria ishoeyi TaxID=1899563 RepID=UPI0025A5FA0F|nr:molybdate ABC transporter substrate-binding protein [Candidatus Venteria ishoeyi]MDM8545560.1 molybdate ABC transporter substrate-binding protein [Candidatus Venteria ishoeyi]